MEFEDILVNVGDYGSYQKRLMFVFLFPSAALLPWFSMNILFLLSVPDHWCHVPELVTSNLSIPEQQRLIRPPSDPMCSMYNLNYTEVLASSNFTIPENTTIFRCNRGWEYDTTNYDSTAASKWDMVCEDSHYTSLVLTLANVGSIIGTPLYGSLSDKLGRRPIFFVIVIVTAATAIASVLMTDFTAFLVLRTVNGSLMPSIFQLPYIILLEIVGPTMRTRMNGIANSSWTFGLCFLPLIAWLTHNWVTLGLVTSSVTVIFLAYWNILPESPRWLVSQERYTEAAAIMAKISQRNNKPQESSELLLQLQKLGERIKKERNVNSVTDSSLDILKYPQLRKHFIIITFCWVANITAYYGLQINAINLGGNEFLNFFLLSLVEVPGFLSSWIFMVRLGRRWCSVVALILTGLACLPPVWASEHHSLVNIISSLIGKYGASAAFMAVYQQSSELYPTTMRSLGMGLSATVAAVATIAVPYIVYLAEYGKYLPFLVIGLICILSGISASFLPETLNENLPQTVTDAENFGESQKYFSCSRRRRPSCYENQSPPVQTVTYPNLEMDRLQN